MPHRISSQTHPRRASFSRFCPAAIISACAIATSHAHATWSILITDTRTGEIVIGSATCVQSIDLQRETPILISGVGAVTAQSAVDSSGLNRMLLRDRLLQNIPLELALEELSIVDTGHNNRQYGMITSLGETLTYSGFENALWAGGITGRIERGRSGPLDDIVYTVQGNILAGEEVVQRAVDSIIHSSQDLPGMLMSAMQAARIAGGDGRCSCSNANPTGCGAPPSGSFKSADVGYMLGTRADDIDKARAFYPITNRAGGMSILDLNQDGMQDIVIGDALNNEVSIFMNSALQGDPLSHVVLDQVIELEGISNTLAMTPGDLNNDGYKDLVLTLEQPHTLMVMLGDGKGSLNDPITLPIPGTHSDDVAIYGSHNDPNGIRIIVSSRFAQATMIYSFNDGELTFQTQHEHLDGPKDLYVGDLDGNESSYMLIAKPSSNSVWIGQYDSGFEFTTIDQIPVANDPVQITTHDLDQDGDQEILVISGTSRRIEIFDHQSGSWVRTHELTINRDGQSIAAGDYNNDGFVDIVSASSSPQRNVQLFVNDGAGGFVFDHATKTGREARFLNLIDMNGNGDLDMVLTNEEATGLLIFDNPQGTPNATPGQFADGEYFLEINIPNQREDDPDPVDQMSNLFEDWRNSLSGQIDATRSRVYARERTGPKMMSVGTIELRDWRGDLLDIEDPNVFQIEHQSDLVELRTIRFVSQGVFEFDLESIDAFGEGSIIIRTMYQDKSVRLMPNYTPQIVSNLSDFDENGKLNFFDVSLFLDAYLAQDIEADINHDQIVNPFDISAFISGF